MSRNVDIALMAFSKIGPCLKLYQIMNIECNSHDVLGSLSVFSLPLTGQGLDGYQAQYISFVVFYISMYHLDTSDEFVAQEDILFGKITFDGLYVWEYFSDPKQMDPFPVCDDY